METNYDRPAPGHALPRVDFARVLYLLRTRWYIAAGTLLLTLLLASAFVLTSPATYQAKAVVQVEQEPTKVIVMEDLSREDFKSLEVLKTIEQTLTSRSLLLRVVQSEKLTDNPIFTRPPAGAGKLSEAALVEKLAATIDAKLRRGTRLIDVTVTHADPILARDLAAAVLREYDRSGFDQNLSMARQVNGFLAQEAIGLRQKMQASEETLQKYREEHGTVSFEEKQNIVIEKLKDLNLKLSDAKSQRLRLEAEVAQLQQLPSPNANDLLALPTVANLPEIADLRRQINLHESEFAQLRKRYLPKHPKYLQAAGQIAELKEALERVAARAGEVVQSSYQAAVETEAKFATAVQEQEKLALELNKLSIPYNALLREVDSDRSILESVLKRVKETQVSQQVQKSPIRIVEAPQVPSAPKHRFRTMIVALALAVGLGGGVALVLLLDSFDTTLRTVDQAEVELGLPSLAAIQEMKGATAEDTIVTERAAESATAEGFRSLRTALSLLADPEPRSFLFTSAVPAEGKSFCSVNAAAAFANRGLKTLLIDADMRRPSLGKVFKRLRAAQGLTDALGSRAEFDACCHATEVANLSLMPSGVRVAKPAELLSAAALQALLEKALQVYDRVVLDSAPLTAVSDTLLIARHAAAVVLVVRGGKTPARVVIRASSLLTRAGITPAGFVMSRLPAGAGADYAYYFYGDKYTGGVYAAQGS